MNGVFFGGNILSVFGELHVRLKKSSSVAGLTGMTTAPCAHSLILCNLIKPSNCSRYLTGIIFPLSFLMEEPKVSIINISIFSQAKPRKDKIIIWLSLTNRLPAERQKPICNSFSFPQSVRSIAMECDVWAVLEGSVHFPPPLYN